MPRHTGDVEPMWVENAPWKSGNGGMARKLSGISLHLMAAIPATHDQPHVSRGRIVELHRRAGLRLDRPAMGRAIGISSAESSTPSRSAPPLCRPKKFTSAMSTGSIGTTTTSRPARPARSAPQSAPRGRRPPCVEVPLALVEHARGRHRVPVQAVVCAAGDVAYSLPSRSWIRPARR
jgi:hypothetical protein